MTKIYQLGEIVEIISGMAFSSRESVLDGEISVINASNVKPNSIIDDSSNLKISSLPSRSPAVIKNDDILMVSRSVPGNNFKSSLIKTSKLAVATNSLYILRIKDQNILPEYLNSLINSKMVQKEILNKARGSTISHVSKKSLEEIKISIPDLETQKKIIELQENIKTQVEITKEIIELKEQILQNTLTNPHQK